MTAAEIRQSFIDFFAKKGHSRVASAPLLPQSPGLLFTNAGMNQFVPFFLGENKAPYEPPRAVNTQKCLRAGGKHNDLEEVGKDSYHHTFFEMLGNWSFGDYFKSEAIDWAWELLVETWGFPPERLYATVYKPKKGEPAELDQEALDLWRQVFTKAGLNPAKHIVFGSKKDNFWMMGETGPCGPCSEIHIDLTPTGDSGGKLVNADNPLCIELWNLVFIQYNADEKGVLRELPAKHVDTGMGLERVAAVMQSTNGFQNFDKLVSNYDSDLFQSLIKTIENISGKKYDSVFEGKANELARDTAIRAIADHIRALSFCVADGILPGNTGRNYVLRRILRRAARYGRVLGMQDTFLARLAPILIEKMMADFPELAENRKLISKTLEREELSFNRTLDRGIELFRKELPIAEKKGKISGDFAFELYDTYGFPLDLTEQMAEERGLNVDKQGFAKLMEAQRQRARAARSSDVLRTSELSTSIKSEFVGYEQSSCQSRINYVLESDGEYFISCERTPFYAEKGGQVGDSGELKVEERTYKITNTLEIGGGIFHKINLTNRSNANRSELPTDFAKGSAVFLQLDEKRRRAIARHHSATHILHWALREILGKEIRQQGSLVAPDRLRFDINSSAIAPEKLAEVERLVNERISENDAIFWADYDYEKVRARREILQFFGDKYGSRVRVVQIGGRVGKLDGYSMEFCAGTHVARVGEIGLCKIKGEGAIAAGIRRVEAICSFSAYQFVSEVQNKLEFENADLKENLANLQKTLSKEQERARMVLVRKELAKILPQVDKKTDNLVSILKPMNAKLFGAYIEALKSQAFPSTAVLLADDEKNVARMQVGVFAGKKSKLRAGELMSKIATRYDGKGGGGADIARGFITEKISANTLKRDFDL